MSKDVDSNVAVAEGQQKMENNTRETWDSPVEFFLSCLGFAVGFGNIWRFPFLCYKNGGAIFVFAYVIMLLSAGLPMFFMELALGQYASLGPNILFPELAPISSGIGWAMMAVTAMTSIYFNMVFAWSLFYLFGSLTNVLAWSHCNNYFNSPNCYTYAESMRCENISMYYYNKECIGIEEFCSADNYDAFNGTHCIVPGESSNETIIEIATKAVHRITSSEDYYINRMLGVSGKTWENMGGLRWELVGCLALAWVIIGSCMIKGVKSSGKVVYFTALFPYVVLVILFVQGLTLEGAYDGISFYILQPNYTKLYEIEVWTDAATQIFYSLSVGFGGLITLSSYSKLKNNCMRDAIMISIANSGTSVFAGFVIYSILGFMAKEINADVKDVVDSGSGLAFIAYPAAVSGMPISPLWSFLFFAMFITLGIDSQFTYVETLATGIFDKFENLRERKSLIMIILCFVLFLLGLPLCLDGGVFLFELLNYFSGGLSVLCIALLEVICVVYMYGFNRFMKNITEDMGINIPTPMYWYWRVTWGFLTPLLLLTILIFSIISFQPGTWGSYIYPDNIQVLGWLTTFASITLIPMFSIYVIVFKRKWGKTLFKATSKFCPAYLRTKEEEVKEEKDISKYSYNNDIKVEELEMTTAEESNGEVNLSNGNS